MNNFRDGYMSEGAQSLYRLGIDGNNSPYATEQINLDVLSTSTPNLPSTITVPGKYNNTLPVSRSSSINSNSQDSLTKEVAIPVGINQGLSRLRNATMLKLIGNPRPSYNQDCQPPVNAKLVSLTTTEDVGPFRVTGLKPAVDSLRRIFAQIKVHEPEVYSKLGTAGMLCCRNVRGSNKSISNHAWGAAIDLKIDGKLDIRGNGRVQVGLIKIYRFFHAEGWFWGAQFSTEDGMHFELAEQTATLYLG